MAEYVLEPDGRVLAGPYGPEVAFFAEGGVVQAGRYGPEIGMMLPDGTIKSGRYGNVLGRVSSDGEVTDPSGRRVGSVSAPVHKRGALLLILG